LRSVWSPRVRRLVGIDADGDHERSLRGQNRDRSGQSDFGWHMPEVVDGALGHRTAIRLDPQVASLEGGGGEHEHGAHRREHEGVAGIGPFVSRSWPMWPTPQRA